MGGNFGGSTTNGSMVGLNGVASTSLDPGSTTFGSLAATSTTSEGRIAMRSGFGVSWTTAGGVGEVGMDGWGSVLLAMAGAVGMDGVRSDTNTRYEPTQTASRTAAAAATLADAGSNHFDGPDATSEGTGRFRPPIFWTISVEKWAGSWARGNLRSRRSSGRRCRQNAVASADALR